MKATRNWGPCACECGKNIGPGDEMVMFEGAMYLAGHEKERRTRRMNAIPVEGKDNGEREKPGEE
ncbi:MAG: hypothetical protein GF331_17710 [Chitinivibrionales bacterium]|nr:hypothetical protein [Chitinivibrionales bacterium]